MIIRRITRDDTAAVTALGISSGLFDESDRAFLEGMMTRYFEGNEDAGHECVICIDHEPVGAAYYEPALATDGTWYLTLIAVNYEQQGRGYGTALMQHIETVLQAGGQRVLLVETSGLPDFALTRSFYIRCGYEEEARVRDYFTVGDDMVLFRKTLHVE